MAALAESSVADEIIGLYQRFVVPSYARGICIARGRGSEVWDAEGRRYLDFGGGVAVNSLGHAHPAIAEVLGRQAGELMHCSNLYYQRWQGRLAEQIVGHAGTGKVFFCNSGAEANEAVFKLARRVGDESGRFEIITAEGSFHGRTFAGISASGQEKLRAGFGPMLPGFRHVPFNDLEAVEAAINEKTIAVHIEGIQGEIGIVPAQADYLLGLRKLCDAHGLLLTMDSVQCGMFRTGAFQSFERILEDESGGETFRPDAIAMAKSLGAGFPIGAAWISERFADVFQPGTHGSTYGGSALACAVASTVFDTVESESLAQNARRQGERLRSHLETLAASRPELIREVRGLGLMIGVEFAADAKEINVSMREAGLLLIPSGRPALRFLPALNVGDPECDEALAIFERVLGKW